MAKNRSDRDAWHLFTKLMPILALVAGVGMGYLLFVEAVIPMIESMVAGYLPQK